MASITIWSYFGTWENKICGTYTQWNITQLFKKHIWVSATEVDKPGAYYIEWNKSERERHILYINTYIWNWERQYKQPCIQNNLGRHRCKEQTFSLNGRCWGWDDLREKHWNMYITICKSRWPVQAQCMKQSSQSQCSGKPRRIVCGWEFSRGGHTTPLAKSCWCMAKAITTL